jgi:hypothetical protein
MVIQVLIIVIPEITLILHSDDFDDQKGMGGQPFTHTSVGIVNMETEPTI